MGTHNHKIRVGPLEIYAEEEGEGSPTLVFIHYFRRHPVN